MRVAIGYARWFKWDAEPRIKRRRKTVPWFLVRMRMRWAVEAYERRKAELAGG